MITGWDYKKLITLTGQSNSGTGYQVKLLVGESSGASGVNFHVENHANSFPSAKNISGDLRFVADDNDTLLPFWVEKVTGSSPNRIATIWVKVAADLGTNQNIYCYYKGTTTNVSNGSNTFILFDDFDGASLDTSIWGLYKGSVSQSSSRITINANSGFFSNNTFNRNHKLTCFGKSNGTSQYQRFYSGFCNSLEIHGEMTGQAGYNLSVYPYSSTTDHIIVSSSSSNLILSSNNPGTTDHLFSLGVGTNKIQLEYDGVSLGSVINTSETLPKKIGLSKNDIGDCSFDYAFLSKFNDTEPSFNTVSSEMVTTIIYTLSCIYTSFVLTGFAALFHKYTKMLFSYGSFTLTGINSLFKKITKMSVTSGSFSLTGFDLLVHRLIHLVLAVGNFALTGIDVIIIKGKAIFMSAGTFVVTGSELNFHRLIHLVAGVGSYTLSGIDALFHKAISIALSFGSYALTGFDLLVHRVIKILLSVGSFSLSGIDVIFHKSMKFVLSVGTYSLSGFGILFHRCYVATLSAGNFVLTGFKAFFSGIGSWLWSRQDKDDGYGWGMQDKDDIDDWTKQDKN